MRTKNITTLGALALAALLAQPTFAQQRGRKPPQQRPERERVQQRPDRTAILQRFDTNRDGVIDAAERRAAHRRLDELLDSLGKGPKEKRPDAGSGRIRGQRGRGAATGDDSDQKRAGDARRQRGVEEEGPARREAASQRRGQRLRERADTDGSGELDQRERRAAGARIREALKDRRTEIFKRFDTDGDGKLNEAEREAAREALQKRIREGAGEETPPPASRGRRGKEI